MEIVILASSLAIYTSPHRERQIRVSASFGPLRDRMNYFEQIEISIDIIRIFSVAALIGFYVTFDISSGGKVVKTQVVTAENATESTPLLANGTARDEEQTQAGTAEPSSSATGSTEPNGTANGTTEHRVDVSERTRDLAVGAPPTSHGSVPINGGKKPSEPAAAGWERPEKNPPRSWIDYLKSYTILFPYLWPSNNRKLQVILFTCMLIVALMRVVQLAVIIEIGVITDYLSGEYGAIVMPWGHIVLYISLRLLQGGNGVLGALRGVLWLPISQYSYRELSVAAFEHVHSLSLDFHLGKKTGEVLSAMGKGSAVNTFLESLTFQVVPMMFDLCVAIAYFLVVFDAYYALVVSLVTFWYIYLTIRMAQWRADIRRDMVNADREEDAVKNDSMISYETVKYFNAERYEFNRYRNAVNKFQVSVQIRRIRILRQSRSLSRNLTALSPRFFQTCNPVRY